MSLITFYHDLRQQVPDYITIVIVTKFQKLERIKELYDICHRDFGENRVQELINKRTFLPDDIRWHMIGHLQTNKVKYIIQFINLIHSVDSLKLILEINKQAQKYNRIVDCLLQFHIAQEETKFGFNFEEACQVMEDAQYQECQNVRICGVMGMATLTDNQQQIRKEFRNLVDIFHSMKKTYFSSKEYFREISMGMSSDYKIAIEEGATILRIGSLIFRN